MAVLSGGPSRARIHWGLCAHVAVLTQIAPISPSATLSCWLVLGSEHTYNLWVIFSDRPSNQKSYYLARTTILPAIPSQSTVLPGCSGARRGPGGNAFEARLCFSSPHSEFTHLLLEHEGTYLAQRGVPRGPWPSFLPQVIHAF